MAAVAAASGLQGSLPGLGGLNPNSAAAQHQALNAAAANSLGMGSGLLSAAAAAAAAGLGLNMPPQGGGGVAAGNPAGLQHMYSLMGGLGMGFGQQQQHPGLHMQQQQQHQHQHPLTSPGSFSPFGGLPPMLSSNDYQHEMLPPDLLAASQLMSALPHHDLPLQADVSSTDGSEKCPNMSWLDAAELVLREANKAMHLQDIKLRIIEKGLVSPGARSSLEAVMYRDTQRGSKRFRRVEGELGVFRLITTEERDDMLRKKRRVAAAKRKSAAARNMAVAKAKRYKEKYVNLRKLIKMMIFENAAMCDEVARTEEKVVRAKDERRFLLQRLLQYQSLSDLTGISSQGSYMDGGRKKHNDQHGSKKDRDRKDKSKHKHKKAKKSDREKEKQRLKDKSNSARHKKRRSTSSAVRRLTQPIPLDPAGKPIFPIILGSLTVHSIGDVISERPGYHTSNYIFPVGYCSSRYYASMQHVGKKCLYTCKILEGAMGPKFEISAEEDTEHPLVGDTASDCHTQLVKAVNKLYKDDLIPLSFSGWGAEFFGFGHPTIQNLIQSGPGARKCISYKWIKFEVAKSPDNSVVLRWHEDNINVSYTAFHKHQSGNKGSISASQSTTKSSTSEPSPSPEPSNNLRTLLTTGLRPDTPTTSQQLTVETSQSSTSSSMTTTTAVKTSSHSPHITRTVTGSLSTKTKAATQDSETDTG